jgi:hypothetical protein
VNSPGAYVGFVVSLRDRLRRWWHPAQWEEDHPSERKERDQPKKFPLDGLVRGGDEVVGPGISGRRPMNPERDFKKPR